MKSKRRYPGLFACMLVCAAVPGPVLAAAGLHPNAKASAAASQQGGGDASKPTLWIIPHTHWEGAVFKTREEYLEAGLPHILTALELLNKYPDYTFVLDQVAYVKPFLERYPEAVPDFRKFVKEGRLQIVGGNDVMLDVNIPSGESWVRQVLYGKGYYQRELGVSVTVGWALDTFGHHAQMPQLLKLAGYKSYWFQRGVPEGDTPSQFLWQGIDGTRIPAFWLPLGYGLFYPSPRSLFEFDQYARGIWQSLWRYSHGQNRVALAGADVVNPETVLPVMVHEFNSKINKPFTIRFGVPTDMESIVARRSSEPVMGGELNPVFQGTYSSRIELKQWLRKTERILADAEKLSALDSWFGAPPPVDTLNRGWEPVLFNEAHDLISGDMVDKVYKDTIRGYQFSETLGDAMVKNGLDVLASDIDTRGPQAPGAEAVPIMVFNSLGWARTDIAIAEVGFSSPGITSIKLLDPMGHSIPVQLVKTMDYSDGGIEDAQIAFIARNVPALGYSIYEVIPERQPPPSGEIPAELAGQASQQLVSTTHSDSGSIENEFYRATFDLWTGAMTKLVMKSGSGDWEALGSRPANVVAQEQDGGDFWELYGTLNGGRFTAMTRKQGLPIPDRSHLSDEWVGGGGRTTAGPVFSEFHVSHPFGSGSFSTTVRLYAGIQRIDIRTQLVNNDKLVRYRVLFPTSILRGQRFDEIPFGSIRRPTDQEFPAQNWIDWSDGARGVALLNRGLPGNNVAQGTLLLSLMRSATISAYPFIGGYETGQSSDLGLELGVKRTLDYALVPHSGDWRAAHIYRAGLEFNNPLIAHLVPSHSGSLPKRWGSVEISPANVVLSAFKPSRSGGVVIRIYEASGTKTKATKIRFQSPIVAAEECNLLEQPIRKVAIQDNSLMFDMGPYQIRTFKVSVSGHGMQANGRNAPDSMSRLQ
ncbi:MAG TPA: glycoside hydrolase family 38 C-terminal domain-containing protein [Terriglobia bacterium]|nr:glycoside hydrolase family 38 C-terminal domain-containing protein [Terriglobia bacterium]